jgi:enterochelin esterase family protein
LELHSKIFPGTVRRYWIYVPAQYDKARPASVLVFQDGQRATNPQGSLRVPTVLDNLIHRGDIPITIGIFITPRNTMRWMMPTRDSLSKKCCRASPAATT